MLWIKRLFWEIGLGKDKNVVFSDSQSAILVNKNASFHSRSKTLRLGTIRLETFSVRSNSTRRKSITVKLVLICLQKHCPKISTLFVVPKLAWAWCALLRTKDWCLDSPNARMGGIVGFLAMVKRKNEGMEIWGSEVGSKAWRYSPTPKKKLSLTT